MPLDIIAEQPHLYLGSRLKRLAERMQADVVIVSERAGLPIQPGQYPLLATLEVQGPLTIGGLTDALQISQPAVTRLAARLAALGLVAIERRGRDQRHKTVALTSSGCAALARARYAVMPGTAAAVREILQGLPADFLDAVTEMERRLAEKPLSRRVSEKPSPLIIRDFTDALAPHFRRINTQWIEAMYRLEQRDIDVLDHPRARIIDTGGVILFAEAPGLGVIGTCALHKTGEGQYELTKMGVLSCARGLGAGEALLRAMLARAAQMGASRLYLLSTKKSSTAIRLYEKLGFVHDAGIMAEFGARYARSDVAMLYAPAAQ